jgi:RNA recognition motif-containing protein
MDIYVGNLAYATSDEDLRGFFAAYGAVTSARVCVDRMTGRSKGFGFVEMPNKDEGQAAINAMNGREVDGRALRVNESQPKPREERRGGGGGGFGGGGYGGGGGGGYGGGGRREGGERRDRGAPRW